MKSALNEKQKTLYRIFIVFIICSVAEYIEFLFIRTDQTIIADNIFTKIFCIAAIIICLKKYKLKSSDIGFRKRYILKYFAAGLSLGLLTFSISYGVEIIILLMQGKFEKMSLHITNFGLNGATSEVSLSLIAVLICIAVNIVNVIAEEGLFRGLILKLAEDKFGFKTANLIQSVLFGCWHIVMVVLCVYDGLMSLAQAVVMAVGYVILAGILALEWGTCVDMTGVLWVGIAEHFFNNFIGNILHVVSTSGVDELQIFRIVLSNILSLSIVLAVSKRRKKMYGDQKNTQSSELYV